MAVKTSSHLYRMGLQPFCTGGEDQFENVERPRYSNKPMDKHKFNDYQSKWTLSMKVD